MLSAAYMILDRCILIDDITYILMPLFYNQTKKMDKIPKSEHNIFNHKKQMAYANTIIATTPIVYTGISNGYYIFLFTSKKTDSHSKLIKQKYVAEPFYLQFLKSHDIKSFCFNKENKFAIQCFCNL